MWSYECVNSGDDYLAHHGILGMKWGVRRYQNEDGTLTSAGKKRYRKASDLSDDELIKDNRRHALESQYKKNHPEPKNKLQKEKETVDSAQKSIQQMRDLNRSIRNSRKQNNKVDLSKMTDDDLRKVINRKNLERQYLDLTYTPDKIDKGQAKVDEILSYGGAVLGAASSAISIALAIRELSKKS